MSVVISNSLAVSLNRSIIGDSLNGNSPIIGYQNLVTINNVTTTTEDPNNPAINLANPATHLVWAGLGGSPSADEYITVILDTTEDVDYVAIARHNFASGLIPVSIEIQSQSGGSPENWTEVIADSFLPTDGPVIFRFDPQAMYAIRVRLQPSRASTPVAPTAAVIFVGKLLLLQRRIYVGHTPIPYGRSPRIATGKSESGNFLGRILIGASRMTSVTLSNLTAAWYRVYMDPFIDAAQLSPFFFGWRPLDYPYEVGYGWITDEPQPSNQRPNGMMQIAFKMTGIV
jgi:hypothetical protein